MRLVHNYVLGGFPNSRFGSSDCLLPDDCRGHTNRNCRISLFHGRFEVRPNAFGRNSWIDIA